MRSDGQAMHGFALAMGEPMHHRPFERLQEAVMKGGPVAAEAMGMEMFDYADEHPEAAAAMVEHMEELAFLLMPRLLERYDVSRFRRIVDVGGGRGFILAPMLETAPKALGVLFDRPQVVEGAKRFFAARGLSERTTFVAGDFLKDELPPGGDAYVLKGIMHDHSDENCLKVLERCRRAMAPGATLLSIEGLIPSDRPGPPYVHWLDLAMLVLLGGRERTLEEYEQLFQAAGLRLERTVCVPIPFWPELYLMEVKAA
jgi:SAM-dependent methyltransferase